MHPHIQTHIHIWLKNLPRSAAKGCLWAFLAIPWMLKKENSPPLSRFIIERFQFKRENGLCWGWKDDDNCGGEDWWCKFRYLVDGCLSKLMGLRMDVVLWRYVKHIHGPCLLIKTFPGNRKPSNWSVKRAAFWGFLGCIKIQPHCFERWKLHASSSYFVLPDWHHSPSFPWHFFFSPFYWP